MISSSGSLGSSDSSSSSGASCAALRPPNTSCIGVQLDDWKLVTGWAGSGGSSGGGVGDSSSWWRSNTDAAGTSGLD